MTAVEETPLSAAGNPIGFGRMHRKEDVRFLRGEGNYVDDLQLPGMLYGAILRSPYAHAKILSVDTSAAEALDGVKAVITGAVLETLGLASMPTLSYDTQAVLATDKVRFQGQEVAFVVAESRYIARDALELIVVDYEPLPAVADAKKALDPGMRRGHPRRQGGQDRQPHLRLGGREPRGHRGRVRCGRGRGDQGHPLPARAPGPDGDLRLGGPHGPRHREAQAVDHDAGAARAPHGLRAGRRAPRAEHPGDQPRHRRRLRQQGADLPRLRLLDRRLHRHRQAGEVDGGPLGEPHVDRVRPRLPHEGVDRRDARGQDPRRQGRRPRRSRRVQRRRPADEVPGRLLPHLHRFLRLPGGALHGEGGVHEQGAGRRGLRVLVPHHRGGVRHRADRRLPRGRAEDGPGRAAAEEPAASRAVPVHHPHRVGVRLRRVREDHARRHGDRRLRRAPQGAGRRSGPAAS